MERSDTTCHASGVHNADTAVWTTATTDGAVPECMLCTTRLLVLPPVPGRAARPPVAEVWKGGRRTHRVAAPAAPHRFIRGPPSLPEARPA
jgi:hypothetical protein